MTPKVSGEGRFHVNIHWDIKVWYGNNCFVIFQFEASPTSYIVPLRLTLLNHFEHNIYVKHTHSQMLVLFPKTKMTIVTC